MIAVGDVVCHVRDPDQRRWTITAVGSSPEIRDGVPTGRQRPAMDDPRAGTMVTMSSPSASGGNHWQTVWMAELIKNYREDTEG